MFVSTDSSHTDDLGAQLLKFVKQAKLLVEADQALTASTNRYSMRNRAANDDHESAYAGDIARDAAACSDLVGSLLSLEPNLNLAWSRCRNQILSTGVPLTPKNPDELAENVAREWEKAIPLVRETLNLSESEMRAMAKPSDDLVQGLRNLKGPIQLPERLLDEGWVEMMGLRLKQLKDLAGTFAPTPMPIGCPNCGSETSPDQMFCVNCGARLDAPKTLQPQPVQRCPNLQCGQPVPVGANFCPVCGTRVKRASR